MTATLGLDIGSITIAFGSQQKASSGTFSFSGNGKEVYSTIVFGSAQNPRVAGTTFSGFGKEVAFSIAFGSYQRPYFNYIQIGQQGQSFRIISLPVTRGDTGQELTMGEANPKTKIRTHIVKFKNGLVQSWVTLEGGSWPQVNNTHKVIVEDGRVKSWRTVADGENVPDPEILHTVEVKRGSVQSWS